MNQFNVIHGDEPNDPPREWNIQLPAHHFKSSKYTPKTSPVVSDITGRLDHHAIDNVYDEVHPSDFPFKSNYESVPDTDTTAI